MALFFVGALTMFTTTVKRFKLLSITPKFNEGRLYGRTYSTFANEDPTYSNITPFIKDLSTRKLLHLQNHPLHILKQKINEFFNHQSQKNIQIPEIPSKYNINATEFYNPKFNFFDSFNPVVTLEQNFDSLLTPLDHSSRRKDESYYLNERELLRCHMTAHQNDILNDNRAALFAGDVYRRDSVDATHYPVSSFPITISK